jgi:uncharacterized protein (TIGR03437 family)
MLGGRLKLTVVSSALFATAALALAQTPVISQGGIINGASFTTGQPVAPGSLVSIFGTDLATSTASASSVPLSTTLGNATVTFGNTAAPLLFTSHASGGDQINAQIPWETAGQSSVQAVVKNGANSSAPASVALTSAAPGLFYFTSGSSNYAIAYGNSDGQFAIAAGAVPGLTTHPAKINDPTTLVLLCTGLGPVNPPLKSGHAVEDGVAHPTATNPVVTVGGTAAQVVFSGASPQFVGVYQINIIIAPGTPTGNNIPLQISMNGITTSNQITIAVSN